MQRNCSAETAVSVLADGMAARHLSASEKNSTLNVATSGFSAVYACCGNVGLGYVEVCEGFAYTSPAQKGRNKETGTKVSSSLYKILNKEVGME